MWLHSLTLHQLEIFAAIAREGSFTRAAHALSLTESAVSQQVKLLEQTVDARLFERSPGRRVQLTEAGGRLLKTCDQIFELVSATAQDFACLRREEQREVAFGAMPHFCALLLPGLYASFQKTEPGITVRVTARPRRELLEGLRQRRLDLLVLEGAVEEAGIENVPFAAMDLVVVGPPGHQLAGAGDIPLERLAEEDLILAGPEARATRELRQRAEERGIRLHVAWHAGGVQPQINAVRSGLGIAVVPFHAVRPLLAAGSLSLLPLEGFPVRTRCFLLSWAGGLAQPADAFRRHLLGQQGVLEQLTLGDFPALAGRVRWRTEALAAAPLSTY